MTCDHIGKVVSWGLNGSSDLVPTVWGCTLCGAIDTEPLRYMDDPVFHKYEDCDDDECFACKIRTLQFATGDANGNLVANGWTNKKWDNELKAYKDARAQGIQPKSTKMKDIKAAVEMSNKTGTAFVAG